MSASDCSIHIDAVVITDNLRNIMFGKILNSVAKTATDFIEDPIGTAVDITTHPIRDGLDVIGGLSEGELREKAALRLGADIAGGMALSELIEWYSEL